MGGLGSGQTTKIGTGPKPKSGPLPPVEPFEPSEELSESERTVWDRLAPHAFRRRTLTKATEYQFVVLCRNVVLERELGLDPEKRGGSDHRGVAQRIDAQLLRFDLAPNGKPHGDVVDLVPAEQSPLEKLKAQRASLRVAG
jgi:hypothetical protein